MQNGYAQRPRSSWGTQKLFGLEEGRQEVGLRTLREETPGREIRQPPAGLEIRAQPETQPGSHLSKTLPALALVLHLGHSRLQEPNQVGYLANTLRSGRVWAHTGGRTTGRANSQGPASALPPAAPARNSTDQGRVTKRSERRLLCLCGLIHIPFPGSGWHLWSPLTLGICSIPLCLITVRTLASPLASLGPPFPPLQKKELAEVVSRTL